MTAGNCLHACNSWVHHCIILGNFSPDYGHILQGLEYIAAILITGKDDEQHIQNRNTVFSRFDSYGLRLQLSKCKFMQRSVTYMGCVIFAVGISPTEERVEAIKKAPRPENSSQLKAFLGMINYHGKFIRNLCSILQPLGQLLQKDPEFMWSPCVKRPSTRQRNPSHPHMYCCITTETRDPSHRPQNP